MLLKIVGDPRYTEGLTYGKPRKGHAEGTVAKHLLDLEANLEILYAWRPALITDAEYWKLKILIHVHDTFKLEGKRLTGHQVSIRHPQSHASLARNFLAEFTDDEELLSIVQFHDEGHALWKKWQKKGVYDQRRLGEALSRIPNTDLYLIFTILDGYTPSKLEDRTPRWFVHEVNKITKTPRAYHVLEVFGV